MILSIFSGFIVCDGCSQHRRNNNRICRFCVVQLQAADILDTIDIRLAVLKNDNLMEYMNDEQLQYNIQYVLRIVLRGKVIDESVEKELIQFMIKLF